MDYASVMTNCFISQAGGAEQRQGMTQLGHVLPGAPAVTGIHEMVKKDGTVILFASGKGSIFTYDAVTTDYTSLFTFPTISARIQSVEMGDKLIFYNGTDRSVYTKDGTTFNFLVPLIESGATTTPTSATGLYDNGLGNIVATNVAVNDLVFNVDLSAYGVITQVTSAFVRHTRIGAAGTGLGAAASDQTTGNRYQILDLIELNIIPSLDPTFLDNTGFAGSGTTATTVTVSGMNFLTTDIRVGDYVYNSTEAAIAQVTAVATALGVTGISNQVENDSLVFLKSAMPVAQKMHVHFGRLYVVDSRDLTKIAFSGADDPQDFTSDSGTLQISQLQPTGETVKTMTSFQRFLVIHGSKNAFFYNGTDPTTTDFSIQGVMPQGTISQFAATPIGNEALFASNDGIQSISLIRFATQLGRAPISAQVNTSIREALRQNPEDQIQCVHYPRRSWVLWKIGSEIYLLNYQPNISQQRNNPNFEPGTEHGSWSLFNGLLAQSNCFFVRNNGDLLCGQNGVIGLFDDNTYDDFGSSIPFKYRTGWLTTTDPKISVKQKFGVYIKPLFEVGANITGTIRVEAPFEGLATDEAEFTAGAHTAPIGVWIVGIDQIGGSGVSNDKLPLYWKGEVFRLTFEKDDTLGPFILSRYSIYSNEMGKL